MGRGKGGGGRVYQVTYHGVLEENTAEHCPADRSWGLSKKERQLPGSTQRLLMLCPDSFDRYTS